MKYLTIIPLLTVATAASADWTPAAVGTNGAVWYADPSSARSVPDGYNSTATKIWVKADFSRDSTVTAREAKILYYFKCDTEQAKYVSWINYRANGTVLDQDVPNYASYRPVTPETVLSGIMKIACP